MELSISKQVSGNPVVWRKIFYYKLEIVILYTFLYYWMANISMLFHGRTISASWSGSNYDNVEGFFTYWFYIGLFGALNNSKEEADVIRNGFDVLIRFCLPTRCSNLLLLVRIIHSLTHLLMDLLRLFIRFKNTCPVD